MAQAILSEPVPAGNPVLSVESLPSIVYRDHPVITTRALADLYGTDQVNIRKNLSANKDRFIPEKHFFRVEGDELRAFRTCVTESNANILPKSGGVLTLWTARGAARHAKMLDTDKAWDVFELLEENYFSRRPPPPATPTGTLTSSQQQEIKELVQAKASAYPDAVKRKVFSQVWMRLQRKFKVPRYEELPASLFGEARDYIIAMQIRSVDAPALPEAETPALPPLRRRPSLDDYRDLFRALPDSPAYWDPLRTRLFAASEAFAKELAAIRDEATRPFRVKRKHEVRTYFDAAIAPISCLLEAAENAHHMAYKSVYDALEGCQSVWRLLRIG